MPVRHFYLLSHYICNGLLFLFSVFWFHMEWIQSSLWRDKGEKSEDYCLFGRYSVQKRKTIYCNNIMINVSCAVTAYGIILSSANFEKKFNIYGNNISISHGHLSSILVSSKTITFIPSGAKTQKKKFPFYSKCNVGASKNAKQAFSTQRYLYSCYRKEFFFSSVSSLMN